MPPPPILPPLRRIDTMNEKFVAKNSDWVIVWDVDDERAYIISRANFDALGGGGGGGFTTQKPSFSYAGTTPTYSEMNIALPNGDTWCYGKKGSSDSVFQVYRLKTDGNVSDFRTVELTENT